MRQVRPQLLKSCAKVARIRAADIFPRLHPNQTSNMQFRFRFAPDSYPVDSEHKDRSRVSTTSKISEIDIIPKLNRAILDNVSNGTLGMTSRGLAARKFKVRVHTVSRRAEVNFRVDIRGTSWRPSSRNLVSVWRRDAPFDDAGKARGQAFGNRGRAEQRAVIVDQ